MAVYKHKNNTLLNRQFLVTNEVEHVNSMSYMLIEWVVNESGLETLTATQRYPIAGLNLTNWELTLDFTGPMAIFHQYIRS
jgi:hypothetical protein